MTNAKKVEIYSTKTCHFCHLAKDFLSARGIPFTDYDVGIDLAKRTEMVKKSGQMGVPVIVVDDKDVVVGFDQKSLSKLVGVEN